ncbi:hypothetical protein KVR01_006429 [Diaporthe batatas]|uniref:uncharacterized protein n=1 Tax=Diaporthe batatas TaxID=748121 RepID=UPI001D0462A0|nr:uncharacterized protein KVR01_006429 [Diaporthe batatas]KAG8164511.1 hypothetical protein KVR01_006429 [Diaporthe batatas]
MLSTWSRAASAHVCSCRACIHATRSPTTRAATLVTRFRCSPFGLASTTLYTTHSGSPTVRDAHNKNVRPAVLRGSIASSSNGNGLTLSRSLSSSAASNQDAPERNSSKAQKLEEIMSPSLGRNALEILESICKMEPHLIRHVESKPAFHSFIRQMHSIYGPKGTLAGSYEILGPNFDLLAESVRQESEKAGILHREPMTNQQFERLHDSMNKLVDSLIIQSYYDETPSDPEYARRSLNSLDSAWNAMRMLRSEGYPRYNHPGLDPAAAEEGRTQLSEMLRKLFDTWDQATHRKYQVAKICYNLLVCPVPPSIHHYNALILGFTRKGMHNLSDLVAECLLADSRLRPTPQTVACLLVHYRQKDDIFGFYGIIRRMLALDNRGMLLRRRWHQDVIDIPDLRKWAMQPEVTTSLKGNWVIEMPTRNREIYESMVSGLLHFGRVKDAAKVFVASLQEKWGISVELFIYLLKSCLYHLDAPAADILLRGFVENARVMNSLILRANCPRKLAEHLYPLLNMGKPPSWPFSEERATMVWHSTTLATTAEDRKSIRRLTVAMFIRQAETHLVRLEPIIRRASRVLYTRLGPLNTIDYAKIAISELSRVKVHNRRLAMVLLKHQKLLKTAKQLEAKTWDLYPGTTEQLFCKVTKVLRNTIPAPTDAGGWQLFEHDRRITALAAEWMRYRLDQMYGIREEAQRVILEIELRLVLAAQFQTAVRGILCELYDVKVLMPFTDDSTTLVSFRSRDDEGVAPPEEVTDDVEPEEEGLDDELPVWAPGPVAQSA